MAVDTIARALALKAEEGNTPPDLSNYVQFTDLASGTKTGVIKGNVSGFNILADGTPQANIYIYENYQSAANGIFIGKGTLENVLSARNYAVTNANNNFSAPQTITGNLTINGDIIQNGETYITHAEQLYTKNAMIYTREGAESGLTTGEYTGLQAIKYDGINDGQLVFDNTGTARVGDIGDTKPLTTRAEANNMTNGEICIWNSSTESIETGNFVNMVRSVTPVTSTSVANPLVSQTEYYLGSQTTLSLTLPTGVRGDYIYVNFISGKTATALTITNSNIVGNVPTIEANKTYELLFNFDGTNWVCQWLSY